MRLSNLYVDIQRITRITLSVLFVSILINSCESNVESDYNPPDDHTMNKDGVLHKTGLDNPDINCVSCHGQDLRGGTSEVSCHECHDKKW